MNTTSASSPISAASTTAATAADHSAHLHMASAIYTAHKTAAKQLHQAQMQLLAAFEGVDVITAKLERQGRCRICRGCLDLEAQGGCGRGA